MTMMQSIVDNFCGPSKVLFFHLLGLGPKFFLYLGCGSRFFISEACG